MFLFALFLLGLISLNSDQDGTSLVDLRLRVVVDAELREEQLVFVFREGALQLSVRLSRGLTALLDKGPEGGVVQVVNVTVTLTPREVSEQVF